MGTSIATRRHALRTPCNKSGTGTGPCTPDSFLQLPGVVQPCVSPAMFSWCPSPEAVVVNIIYHALFIQVFQMWQRWMFLVPPLRVLCVRLYVWERMCVFEWKVQSCGNSPSEVCHFRMVKVACPLASSVSIEWKVCHLVHPTSVSLLLCGTNWVFIRLLFMSLQLHYRKYLPEPIFCVGACCC